MEFVKENWNVLKQSSLWKLRSFEEWRRLGCYAVLLV
jgi:hypothetical protein